MHGLTILLVEQNARHALTLARRAYIMETGRIAHEGSGKELLADPSIRAAYLGMQCGEKPHFNNFADGRVDVC